MDRRFGALFFLLISLISKASSDDWSDSAEALYTTQPDVTRCQTGTLKPSVKTDVLERLNAIRAIHHLEPVTYSEADDEQTSQSSLIMAANGQLSHNPPTTWKCYSEAGKKGAGSSNLFGGTISPYLGWKSDDDYIAGWLTEGGGSGIGHRRWMLYPYLGKISYGRVSQVLDDGSRTSAATLKIFGFTDGVEDPEQIPPFVAYPYGDYPARYMDAKAYLSFSVVMANDWWQNSAVKFDSAQIRVTEGSTALPVTDVMSDNDGYGIPNSVQWKVTGLQQNVQYTVRITGVTGAPQSDYEYTFKWLGSDLQDDRQRIASSTMFRAYGRPDQFPPMLNLQ